MTIVWLVWYYARALELPYPILRTLLTYGLPIKQIKFVDRIELHVFDQRHCSYEPAVQWADGTKAWYRNGQLHRDDGPAIEHRNVHKEWYRNGQRQRDDGPAVEYADGIKSWYRNGQQHCDDGPALEYAGGYKG